MRAVLEAQHLTKKVQTGEGELVILDDINLRIEPAETVAIVGASGSGKSTLLGLMAGLDTPSSGDMYLEGHNLTELDEDGRAQLRGQAVGFVFQSFQLLPGLTALENVMLPIELKNDANARPQAEQLLQRVGLEGRINHYPNQLSGGEQQRVAIARAFASDARILFADEPTGNLDTATGARIIDLLFSLNAEFGTTLVLVTHDDRLAQRCGRLVRLAGGRIVDDVTVAGTGALADA